jgi:hypothetical protein
MCVLYITSNTDSLRSFVNNSKMPIYQAHEKGAQRHKSRKYPPFEDFGFSCKVSDKNWDDLSGQIEDAIAFLKKYEEELTKLIDSYQINDIHLDFPYYCRHSRTVFMQGEFLPPELILRAGKLNTGIALSLYPKPKKTWLEAISEKFRS